VESTTSCASQPPAGAARQSLVASHPGHRDELAEARRTPIDQIPEPVRAAVLSRIVTQTHLVSSAFQSAI